MQAHRQQIAKINRFYATSIQKPDGPNQEALRKRADMAVAGKIALYYSTLLDVGRSGIDWSGGQHSHQQWSSQLNRFQAHHALAAAYAQTGDESYALAAADYIRDWMRAHPVNPGWQAAAYDNTLNLPIRVKTWLENMGNFMASPHFDDAFLDDVVTSVSAQLNWLLGHLKGRGNWYIVQGDALLSGGLHLNFLSNATAWRTHGVKILNESFRRQVLADGAHIECNPSYHDWMRRVFQQHWQIARAMPELGLDMTAEAIQRMWRYTLASHRPNGSNSGLHDGKGLFTGERSASWADGYLDFCRQAELPAELPPPNGVFPQARQAFLRDNWDADATYLTFNASPLESAHWHADRNAIQLHAHGRTLIADPGSFTYDGKSPFQAYGMSTRAHSTINFRSWDQTWSTQEMHYHGAPGYDLVHSLYDGGYWQGCHRGGWFDPGHGQGFHGQHHRAVFWIHGRALFVLDHVYQTAANGEKAMLESVWQFAPGKVSFDEPARLARTHHEDANLLMLFPILPDGARFSIHEGEKEPLRGWVAGDTATDIHHPAPQLVVRVDQPDAWHLDLVTVLLPFKGSDAPVVRAGGRSAIDEKNVASVTLHWSDDSIDEIIWHRRLQSAIFNYPGLDTDACLVHLHRDPSGRVENGLAVDATWCEPYLKNIRSAPATLRF